MRKKQYDKPSMKAVALQQRTALLAGSVNGSVDATMNGTFVEEPLAPPMLEDNILNTIPTPSTPF